MRRIRKPKHGRLASLLIGLLAVISLLVTDSWLPSIILLVIALILASIGKNYWECTTCGTLTERV
jgi:hypothetical protein